MITTGVCVSGLKALEGLGISGFTTAPQTPGRTPSESMFGETAFNTAMMTSRRTRATVGRFSDGKGAIVPSIRISNKEIVFQPGAFECEVPLTSIQEFLSARKNTGSEILLSIQPIRSNRRHPHGSSPW